MQAQQYSPREKDQTKNVKQLKKKNFIYSRGGSQTTSCSSNDEVEFLKKKKKKTFYEI